MTHRPIKHRLGYHYRIVTLACKMHAEWVEAAYGAADAGSSIGLIVAPGEAQRLVRRRIRYMRRLERLTAKLADMLGFSQMRVEYLLMEYVEHCQQWAGSKLMGN